MNFRDYGYFVFSGKYLSILFRMNTGKGGNKGSIFSEVWHIV